MPHVLLKGLQSVPPLLNVDWKERNAIVVLGIGVTRWPDSSHFSTHAFGFSRIHEAARLYLQCKKALRVCTVIASGGDPGKKGVSEAEVMKRELSELGLPDSDVVMESKSNNTFQNAQFSSEVLKAQSFEQTLLVTSGSHLRRALLYFAHFNITALGAPSDRMEAKFSAFPIALNFAINDIAAHEYSGFLRYFVYSLLGWNSASSQPGTP